MKMVKYHLVLCDNAQSTASLVSHSIGHVQQHGRHLSTEKVLKEVKNPNRAGHDEGRVLQGFSEWRLAFPQIAHMHFADSGPMDRSYYMLERCRMASVC